MSVGTDKRRGDGAVMRAHMDTCLASWLWQQRQCSCVGVLQGAVLRFGPAAASVCITHGPPPHCQPRARACTRVAPWARLLCCGLRPPYVGVSQVPAAEHGHCRAQLLQSSALAACSVVLSRQPAHGWTAPAVVRGGPSVKPSPRARRRPLRFCRIVQGAAVSCMHASCSQPCNRWRLSR